MGFRLNQPLTARQSIRLFVVNNRQFVDTQNRIAANVAFTPIGYHPITSGTAFIEVQVPQSALPSPMWGKRLYAKIEEMPGYRKETPATNFYGPGRPIYANHRGAVIWDAGSGSPRQFSVAFPGQLLGNYLRAVGQSGGVDFIQLDYPGFTRLVRPDNVHGSNVPLDGRTPVTQQAVTADTLVARLRELIDTDNLNVALYEANRGMYDGLTARGLLLASTIPSDLAKIRADVLARRERLAQIQSQNQSGGGGPLVALRQQASSLYSWIRSKLGGTPMVGLAPLAMAAVVAVASAITATGATLLTRWLTTENPKGTADLNLQRNQQLYSELTKLLPKPVQDQLATEVATLTNEAYQRGKASSGPMAQLASMLPWIIGGYALYTYTQSKR